MSTPNSLHYFVFNGNKEGFNAFEQHHVNDLRANKIEFIRMPATVATMIAVVPRPPPSIAATAALRKHEDMFAHSDWNRLQSARDKNIIDVDIAFSTGLTLLNNRLASHVATGISVQLYPTVVPVPTSQDRYQAAWRYLLRNHSPRSPADVELFKNELRGVTDVYGYKHLFYMFNLTQEKLRKIPRVDAAGVDIAVGDEYARTWLMRDEDLRAILMLTLGNNNAHFAAIRRDAQQNAWTYAVIKERCDTLLIEAAIYDPPSVDYDPSKIVPNSLLALKATSSSSKPASSTRELLHAATGEVVKCVNCGGNHYAWDCTDTVCHHSKCNHKDFGTAEKRSQHAREAHGRNNRDRSRDRSDNRRRPPPPPTSSSSNNNNALNNKKATLKALRTMLKSDPDTLNVLQQELNAFSGTVGRPSSANSDDGN